MLRSVLSVVRCLLSCRMRRYQLHLYLSNLVTPNPEAMLITFLSSIRLLICASLNSNLEGALFFRYSFRGAAIIVTCETNLLNTFYRPKNYLVPGTKVGY